MTDLNYAGTPEDYLIVNPQFPKTLNIPALSCALLRADALLESLMANGEQTEQGVNISHGAVINILWATQGLILQAQKIVLHSSDIQV
ncbi:MAG: hypothetical protein O7D86_03395 [Proteobacteria bacterium]|nr:hypothetical protein [Pseudomonadota bacterium]